jgi:L-alanine-DL-glutamate epimerase-like enolase superfamily enzyme
VDRAYHAQEGRSAPDRRRTPGAHPFQALAIGLDSQPTDDRRNHEDHGAQKYGLAGDITVDRDGLVHAPGAPGLGYEIDFALIERKKISTLR